MQIGMLLSVPAGMLRFKSTVQCVLDFQGTLFDFLTVPDGLAQGCDFGSNLRFLFSEKNLLFRGGAADFVPEFGTLVYQGFQLCLLGGTVCQQFRHSLDIMACKIPGLSVNIVQMPEASPKLGTYRVVSRAFGQDSQLIAVVEVQLVDFGSAFSGLIGFFYYRHNSVVNIALVVNATMLTSFLIKVKLSLYNFIRSHIQNIKELKRRCAHGVCRSSAGKENCERLDRSVAVIADIAVFPENFGKYPNCIC